ncbi:MAG: acyl-CoA dehydrogenase family protein, partial [bacterium]
MTDTYSWPFFTDAHRTLAAELRTWAQRELSVSNAHSDVDADCRARVKQLGEAGWLRYAVPAQYGGMHEQLDVRSLCIARETLSRVSGLADFSFA